MTLSPDPRDKADVQAAKAADATARMDAAVAALCQVDDGFLWVVDDGDRNRLRTEFDAALRAVFSAEDLLAELTGTNPSSCGADS